MHVGYFNKVSIISALAAYNLMYNLLPDHHYHLMTKHAILVRHRGAIENTSSHQDTQCVYR